MPLELAAVGADSFRAHCFLTVAKSGYASDCPLLFRSLAMPTSPCASLVFLSGSALAERLQTAQTLAVMPFSTPWGQLVLAAAGDVLLLCDWLDGRHLGAHAKRIEEACKAHAGHRPEILEDFRRAILSGAAWRFPNEAHDDPAQACLHAAALWLDHYLFDAQCPPPALTLGLIGTERQRSIWAALAEIGPGETVSYGQLALRTGLGSPRSVGQAVARNAFSMLLPCHRVLSANGAATGYAGGLDAKRGLLAHEGVRLF